MSTNNRSHYSLLRLLFVFGNKIIKGEREQNNTRDSCGRSLFVYNTEDTGVRPNHELRFFVGEWLYLALKYPLWYNLHIPSISHWAIKIDKNAQQSANSRKSTRTRKIHVILIIRQSCNRLIDQSKHCNAKMQAFTLRHNH